MIRDKGDHLDFPDLDAARAWLVAHGYVYGSMQRADPIGVMPEETCCGVSKWRNMTAAEQLGCVAVLTVEPQDLSTPPGMSCAPVYVQAFDRPWRLTWQHQHEEVTR